MLRHNASAMAAEIGMGMPTNNHNNALTQPLSPTTMNNHLNKSTGGGVGVGGSPLDALPKQFVLSMKTLFDILDDRQTGFVKFSDIEKGWQDDGCKGLPRGVIDSLRKVTPPSGLLSFERFCAGLKLCLLRNQTVGSAGGGVTVGGAAKSPLKPPRPPSAPLFDIENTTTAAPNAMPTNWSSGNPTATVRPHSHTHIAALAATQRTLSMPQLSPADSSELEATVAAAADINAYNTPPPPPKPPRASVTAAAAASTTAPPPPALFGKAEIRHALQNWQMGILLNEMDGTAAATAANDKRHNFHHIPQQTQASHTKQQQHFAYRGCADGGSSSATDSGGVVNSGATIVPKKSSSGKRREPRRHTLQNGIDYNMLKRLKQFEEEREVLLLGLDAVEKARDWYLQQVATVQERIKYLGRMAGGTQGEQWSEVQQERLNFQRARVLEVNRNLAVLTDTWERGGFPLQHFNLATIRAATSGIPHGKSTALQRSTTTTVGGGSVLLSTSSSSADARLRQQNRLLSNEVNLKSDRIVLLEREKQTLLRDLIELQQRMGLGCSSGGGVRLSTGGGGFVSVLSQSSPVCSSSSGGLGDADVVY